MLLKYPDDLLPHELRHLQNMLNEEIDFILTRRKFVPGSEWRVQGSFNAFVFDVARRLEAGQIVIVDEFHYSSDTVSVELKDENGAKLYISPEYLVRNINVGEIVYPRRDILMKDVFTRSSGVYDENDAYNYVAFQEDMLKILKIDWRYVFVEIPRKFEDLAPVWLPLELVRKESEP